MDALNPCYGPMAQVDKLISCQQTLLTPSSFDWPGNVDQKNPLQSGSSKIYGKIRVSSRTQLSTDEKRTNLII